MSPLARSHAKKTTTFLASFRLTYSSSSIGPAGSPPHPLDEDGRKVLYDMKRKEGEESKRSYAREDFHCARLPPLVSGEDKGRDGGSGPLCNGGFFALSFGRRTPPSVVLHPSIQPVSRLAPNSVVIKPAERPTDPRLSVYLAANLALSPADRATDGRARRTRTAAPLHLLLCSATPLSLMMVARGSWVSSMS